jgi:proline iminopeptidase
MLVGGALERLAQTRSVVFYDQRGTSRSSDSRGDETIDKYVEDIESIRKTIGSPKVDFIGHSFGGYLAMAYTAKYPDRVRGLILVASAPPKMGDLVQVADALFPDSIEAWRAKRATLGRNNPGSDYEIFQSMEFVDSVALGRFLDAVKNYRYNMEVNNIIRRDMANLDYTAAVRRFSQPALIINGRWDAIVPPVNGWRLHKELRNSSFRVIEAAGHLPHIERPDAFLKVVKPFLTSLDRSAPTVKKRFSLGLASTGCTHPPSVR